MVRIVVAIMTEVMAHTSDQHRHGVKVVEITDFEQITLCHHNIQHLCDVQSVKIVMVLDFFNVTLLNIVKECHEFLFVDTSCRVAWKLSYQVHHKVSQGVSSTHKGDKVENVKVQFF